MSKNKKQTLYELEADMDINETNTEVRIRIESKSKAELTPQAIIDAVSDMLFSYYGITQEEWKAINSNSALDS